ncbi:molybdenum ABC transporter ATP-binding protein [Jiella marina]|uniref:molybdenum ABC transporter ATP-binding protein n=1 Tax=Jiella sp. LLJ827 TaxID=2917712 RepID=UPI0021008D5A|nr:molybdenum ABC transporter ATP-binding protein [Jiella sp. LLJ827]MCQ0987260.1 molybdenum ABC transporter ATP-binding protein [Jiella sp. LLJ827]
MTAADTIDVRFEGRLGAFRLAVGFQAPGRGVTALFGPSGCGKTSVLRAIAGLDHLTGLCRIGDEVWQDGQRFLPTHRRPVGYVFQEANLFPHLSVKRNLLYSSRGKVLPAAEGRIGFKEVVELLKVEPLLERAPARLSGGERQRVAIGRALLSQPRLLLMDEPLSALDQATRQEILPFLERLHDTLALPILYVSHDMREVERLADHVVLMREGRVLASGPLTEIQSDPDLPLARERDARVSLEGVVATIDAEYGIVGITVEGGQFLVPGEDSFKIGDHLRLAIGADDVSLSRVPPAATSILNVLPAVIVSARALGRHQMLVALGLGDNGKGDRLLARVTRKSWEQLDLAEGVQVHAQIKGVALAPR